MANHGGWNKCHGTVEKTPRVDSFDPVLSEGGGALFVCADGMTQLIEFDRYTDYGPDLESDREIVELWSPDWSQTVELSRKENGFGGSQVFFLCPACGERRRYLYLAGDRFLCRKCSRLNYQSQQETRSGSMYYYRKGMALVEKRLYTWPRVRLDGFSFCAWLPERPRYMHRTTYGRYLRRFAKYQKQHQHRQLEDIARLLKMFQ